MIKKILKFLGWLVLILFVFALTVYFIMDESVPDGTQGVEAEQLADEMLAAINKEAYDTLEYIEFTFRNIHHYQWDRAANTVNVKWEEQEVYLDLNRSIDGFTILEYKAYEYFINDSFWLVAPFKVRDDGVIRSTVDMGINRGLLVTYTSGGVTPGDSYLWIIDGKGYPVAWKLWTSNVPLGGLKFSWEGWVSMEKVWFSTYHNSSILDIPITNLSVR